MKINLFNFPIQVHGPLKFINGPQLKNRCSASSFLHYAYVVYYAVLFLVTVATTGPLVPRTIRKTAMTMLSLVSLFYFCTKTERLSWNSFAFHPVYSLIYVFT